jgi:hypothetical protein
MEPCGFRNQNSFTFEKFAFPVPPPPALCYRFGVNSPLSPSPQFGTAEYVGVQGGDHCQYCHQAIAGTYYRVHDAMACPVCAERVRAELAKDTHAAYVRAVVFGIGAALAGLALYAAFEIETGWVIGYVSLAVGWMVGTAMKKGSGGVGGRRYQITAAALTYAAVSMAAIPVWIHYAIEHRQELAQAQTKSQSAQGQGRTGTESGQQADAAPAPEQDEAKSPPQSRLEVFGHLALLGIASPFLELQESGPTFGWLIGLFILFIGIRIAWRLTGGVRVNVFGPFENAPPAT